MSARVLIADDSPLIREQIRAIVDLTGVESDTAENGEEAWKLLTGGTRYNMILCDINMPKLSGLGLIKRAHAQGITAHTPFVMVTTEGKAALMREARSHGAKGWLTKPLDATTLTALVEGCIGASR